VPLRDASLALLLERRFPDLKEHLLTAVELSVPSEDASAYNPELVERTHAAASQAVEQLPVAELFRRGPLARALVGAAVLMVAVPVFALCEREAFGVWVKRLALDPAPWPRRVHLEVVGFAPDSDGIRVHKMAQDDDLELLVHAATSNFV